MHAHQLYVVEGKASDDPALIDVGPATKKPVKAQKAAIAAKNKKIRDMEMAKLRDEIKKQRGSPTPEQQAYMKQLEESQASDDHEMAKLDQMPGETDPEL